MEDFYVRYYVVSDASFPISAASAPGWRPVQRVALIEAEHHTTRSALHLTTSSSPLSLFPVSLLFSRFRRGTRGSSGMSFWSSSLGPTARYVHERAFEGDTPSLVRSAQASRGGAVSPRVHFFPYFFFLSPHFLFSPKFTGRLTHTPPRRALSSTHAHTPHARTAPLRQQLQL